MKDEVLLGPAYCVTCLGDRTIESPANG